MASLEDITGIVFIAIIFIVAGIMLLNNYAKMSAEKERFALQYDLEDSYSSTLSTLLEITEPKSRRSFGELIGSASFYRNDKLMTSGGVVLIEEEFNKLLKITFPNGNYYFKASSPLRKIDISFVVDGSDTLTDELDYLADNMDLIVSKADSVIGTDYDISVYVLNWANSSGCDDFNVPCYYLNWSFFYANETYDLWDLKKYRYKLTKPSNFLDEEEVWKSDWQSAMVALILNNGNDMDKLRVYFPITDTLPGSTEYFYPCPRQYAWSVLERDTPILSDSNVIVNPIFSQNNDPVLYCDKDVIEHMEKITLYTNGEIIRSRDNFAMRFGTVLTTNFENMVITAGEKRTGRAYGMQGKLPMPNGQMADMQLLVYENE